MIPKKRDIRLTKNYSDITTISKKVYKDQLLNRIKLKIEKNFGKKFEQILEKLLHKFFDSEIPSNQRGNTSKICWGNTIFFLFHILKKYRQSRTNILVSLRNCYRKNDALEKYESNDPLNWYIYIVLFGPVEPEFGVIPSEQENHSKAEHLNFPGRKIYQDFFRFYVKI